jgi:hypothetical protein
MVTKAIKGVEEGKWATFKALAAKKDKTVGELFNESVEIIDKQNAESQWEKILEHIKNHPSRLTDADVKRMREFRKRFKMRAFE